MAKPLTVVFRGDTVHLELEKVERSKLYGYVDHEVVDDSGKPCELATLISDGHSIAGKGARPWLTSARMDCGGRNPTSKPWTSTGPPSCR